MLLKNKVAFVTGGSKGIGLSICKKFILHGVSFLAYFSRTKSADHAELEESAKKNNATFVHYEGSVDSEEQLMSALSDFHGKAGCLDILVNNAGITKDKLIIGLNTEDWDTVINVNLKSVFLACKAGSKIMLKQRSGTIVNVTSIIGMIGNVGQSNYAASKAGIIGFTKSIAKETARRGVRVNAIAPGLIDTGMSGAIPKDFKEKILEQIPLGRIGDGDEVADSCVFLCSDMSSYITGHVLVVSGGMQ